MSDKFKSIDTKLIHAGEPEPRVSGAVAMPIFQTAMFETFGGEGYHNVRYIRLNNTPNHDVLHAKLAALENAEKALVTASGMAAISTALLAALKMGDHLLIQDSLYGGTHALVRRDLPDWGIEYDFVDPNDPGSWESKLKPNTKVFYIEAISNPKMGVGNIKAVVEFAKAHKLTTMIDNTFTSPINFRPAEWDIDLSLHSGTKYLNGHSDIVCGAVIGKADWVDRIKLKLDHLGGTLDPHACFLLHRGLKTLGLRVRFQNDSALKIARFLESHPKVVKISYPGLESHPNHALARDLFDGFGGMLSFQIDGGLKEVDQLMRNVAIPVIAPSLGGVESLLTRPAATSHASLSPEDREEAGVPDTMVRMSVGIEDPDDIIADLDRALA
jgi:cystathionine beta-lyase/cystathionine gamma-synthase